MPAAAPRCPQKPSASTMPPAERRSEAGKSQKAPCGGNTAVFRETMFRKIPQAGADRLVPRHGINANTLNGGPRAARVCYVRVGCFRLLQVASNRLATRRNLLFLTVEHEDVAEGFLEAVRAWASWSNSKGSFEAVLTATDIMNPEVIVLPCEATVGKAIDVLTEHHISGLPVVDADGHILGVVTEYALLAIAYDASVATDPVCQHMTKEAISVECDDPVTRVADLFILHRIRRVLVMQEGKLVGLISRRDLLKAARKSGKAMCSTPTLARGRGISSPDSICVG